MSDVRKNLTAAALAAICSAALLGTAHAGVAENKKAVDAFFELLHEGKVDEAFDKYVGTRYVQHDPRFPDGIEGTKNRLKEQKAKADPSKASSYEAIKTVGEGDYVVQHARVRNAGRPDVSLISWFKFEKGKIVEHWTVVQEVPATSANSNDMFGK